MAHSTNENPVEWPARAVVTAGMPYGNKPLHFGHVGGVFVPADAFAGFLRDRGGGVRREHLRLRDAQPRASGEHAALVRY